MTAGTLSLAAFLAACSGKVGGGGGGQPAASLTPGKDLSDTEKSMIWANWAFYLDEDDSGGHPTLDAFTKKTGIAVKYDVAVDDNSTYFAKVRDQLELGQDIGADTVCLTDWMASIWIQSGFTQTLDKSAMPNASANLNASLQHPDFDKDRTHTMPWQSGFAGLAWNKEKLPKGLKSVSDLWDPSLKGRVGVLSEMRDTIGIIMLSQGVDITGDAWGDAEFTKAIDEFSKQVKDGQVRNIKGNSYADDLKNEDTLAAIVWSGDITAINAEVGDKFGFALPDSGGTLWSDNLMVPIGSPHKKNAETLMNYYYDPEVAAEVAAWVNYICPVQGAREAMTKIDKSLADNELIFPSDQLLSKSHGFMALDQSKERKYQQQFAAVIGA
jgi:spermidine/putrescine transport system substrate-binding protein